MAPERLSKEQLEKALGRRVRRPCPICEGAEWDVPGDLVVVLPTQDDPTDALKVRAGDDGDIEFSGLFALPMVCRDCGFIAQFHYGSLSEDAEH